jgi:hypothetical protein
MPVFADLDGGRAIAFIKNLALKQNLKAERKRRQSCMINHKQPNTGLVFGNSYYL